MSIISQRREARRIVSARKQWLGAEIFMWESRSFGKPASGLPVEAQWSSTRRAEQLLRRQQSVHRAGPEASQIEGHKLEAQRLEYAGELRRHGGIERPPQFLARDFNADDLPMVPHPELPEAQPAQSVFALFDYVERLSRNGATVFDTRRKAGRRGLIPDAQASSP